MGSYDEPCPLSSLTTPPGWSCHINQDKQTLYTNHFTQEQVGAVAVGRVPHGHLGLILLR